MIAQHPQLVSTVVFAERLKALSKKANYEGSSQAAGMVGGEMPLPGFVVLHETPSA